MLHQGGHVEFSPFLHVRCIRYRIYQVEILVQQNSEYLPHGPVPLNNNGGENRPASGQIYTYSACISYIHVEGQLLQDGIPHVEAATRAGLLGVQCWQYTQGRD